MPQPDCDISTRPQARDTKPWPPAKCPHARIVGLACRHVTLSASSRGVRRTLPATCAFSIERSRWRVSRFGTVTSSNILARQGQRLLQIGVALLLYSSLDGFVLPYLRSQRIGLSVHTLSALQGVLFLALGVVWPKLVPLQASGTRPSG
jgi:hypothetical protein